MIFAITPIFGGSSGSEEVAYDQNLAHLRSLVGGFSVESENSWPKRLVAEQMLVIYGAKGRSATN